VATLLFPDNTVICNFAAVDRIDLFEALIGEHGRWTQAVEFEAKMSRSALPAVGQVIDGGLLGEPLEVADADAVGRIREAEFGGDEMDPLKHLGESETCYLLRHDIRFQDARWITDDRAAYDYAKRQGILTWDTLDCLQALVASCELSSVQAFGLVNEMVDLERTPRRIPEHHRELVA